MSLYVLLLRNLGLFRFGWFGFSIFRHYLIDFRTSISFKKFFLKSTNINLQLLSINCFVLIKHFTFACLGVIGLSLAIFSVHDMYENFFGVCQGCLTTLPLRSRLCKSWNILFRSGSVGRSGIDNNTNSALLKLGLGLSLAINKLINTWTTSLNGLIFYWNTKGGLQVFRGILSE